MTRTSRPANRSTKSAVVSTAAGAESSRMNCILASGTAGSIGTYAAPVLTTASIATMACAHRGNSSATYCPEPTPWPISMCAR